MASLWGAAVRNLPKFPIYSTFATRTRICRAWTVGGDGSTAITKCKGNGILSQIKTTVESCHLTGQTKRLIDKPEDLILCVDRTVPLGSRRVNIRDGRYSNAL